MSLWKNIGRSNGVSHSSSVEKTCHPNKSDEKMSKIGNNFKKTVLNAIIIGSLIIGAGCSPDYDFYEDAQLDKLAEEDRRAFSYNIAQNQTVQNIFARRRITDVRGWFYNKMSARYFLRPDLMERGAAGTFSPWSGNIYFAHWTAAQRSALRAHERSHEVSYQRISSNRRRVGFVTSGRNDRLYEIDENGFSEGVTCHFAVKLLGISFQQYQGMMGTNINSQDARMVNEFRQKLNCDETLFEAFLFDPSILHREFNRRSGDNQAWRRLMQAWGEWHRHSRATIFCRDFLESIEHYRRHPRWIEAERIANEKADVVRERMGGLVRYKQ